MHTHFFTYLTVRLEVSLCLIIVSCIFILLELPSYVYIQESSCTLIDLWTIYLLFELF